MFSLINLACTMDESLSFVSLILLLYFFYSNYGSEFLMYGIDRIKNENKKLLDNFQNRHLLVMTFLC